MELHLLNISIFSQVVWWSGEGNLKSSGNNTNCICVLLVSVYRAVGGAVRELEEALYTVLTEHEGRGLTVPGNHTNLHMLNISICSEGVWVAKELEEDPYTVLAEHKGWEEEDYPKITLICIC
jgi:hypothetical protein